MNNLRESLDNKARKQLQSNHNRNRSVFERRLCPTSATLIIVPIALLEHWYEQIMKHINLLYVDGEDNGRGLVYLDGLGDIMDVQPPIARLEVRKDGVISSIEMVSSYMIVVTTIERCAQEGKLHRSFEDFDWRDASGKGVSPLLQLRWLRLIVDEGHELSLSKQKDVRHSEAKKALTMLYHASMFITFIAAERRWIMSGTPATGADTEVGLQKLFVLLSFLRHPDHGLAAGPLSEAKWKKEFIDPCLRQNPEAWSKLTRLLKTAVIRHLKVIPNAAIL